MIRTVIGIDPGTSASGVVTLSLEERRVIWADAALPNAELPDILRARRGTAVAIERIAAYGPGMNIGEEIYQTCFLIGALAHECLRSRVECHLIKRKGVRGDLPISHVLLGDNMASDPRVIAALYARFGGSRRAAVGLKKTPGPCYGVKAHAWQALAAAVVCAETRLGFDQKWVDP